MPLINCEVSLTLTWSKTSITGKLEGNNVKKKMMLKLLCD